MNVVIQIFQAEIDEHRPSISSAIFHDNQSMHIEKFEL